MEDQAKAGRKGTKGKKKAFFYLGCLASFCFLTRQIRAALNVGALYIVLLRCCVTRFGKHGKSFVVELENWQATFTSEERKLFKTREDHVFALESYKGFVWISEFYHLDRLTTVETNRELVVGGVLAFIG